MFSTMNIFKGCLPLKGQHTSSSSLKSNQTLTLFLAHFQNGWSSNPTLNPQTLLTIAIPTLPLHDIISPKLSFLWRHITETCLVMMSYHRNLPCYDVISQKLALLWRHITETCLVMTSYHRNLPLIPQVPVTCIAKEELFNWNDRKINRWHNKGNATINHLQ
jgi:hypothetical protein